LFSSDLPKKLRALVGSNGGNQLEERVNALADGRGKDLENHSRESWHRALDVLLATLVDPDAEARSPYTRELVNRLKTGPTTDIANLRDRALGEMEQCGFPRRYCRALVDTIISIAPHAVAAFQPNKSNRIICDLLDWCQSADSKLRFLSTFVSNHNAPLGTRSCFGTEMGVFEEWSLFFCINAYYVGASKSFGSTGPIPLWRLFFRDFLGIELPRSNDEVVDARRDFDLCLNRVLQQMRIYELDSQDGESGSSVDLLRERGVTSEFALFCVAPAGDGDTLDFTSVKPVLLLSTSLSEPFHTCKLALRVPQPSRDSGRGSDPVMAHWRWVQEVFSSPSDATRDRLKQVADYIGPVRSP
jgi:hypothetical protein